MMQRSDEWFNAKIGNVGASRIADILAKTKSGYSASRNNYMTDLILEKITGKKTDSFTSAAMQYGIDMEADARSAYELETFNIVTECGFILHPEIENAGASPDGLIGDDGVLEIKCFQPSNHLNYLLTGEIETKYIYQMQWQMECTGRSHADFVAYNPNFPDNMKLFIKRVNKDQKLVDTIKAEVIKFLEEMKVKLTELQNKFKEV